MKENIYKGILIGGSVLFCILLSVLGYAIPVTDAMQKHALESGKQLNDEGNYPEIMTLYNSRLDNYTDALMINTATFDDPSPVLEKVFANYNCSIPGEGPIKGLYYSRLGENTNIGTYSRYWHGYVPFVKAMLLITNYNGIRQINFVLQSLLFALIISLLVSQKGMAYGVAYTFCWLSLIPTALIFSLQYSSIYYIYSFSMLLMLINPGEIITKVGYPVFFMIIGIFTSWIDFLTYPIAALGIPLVLVFILENIGDVKKILQRYMKISLAWGAGYLGMWALKWILSSIYLHQNIIANAFGAIVFRTSNGYNGETWTKGDVIWLNMSHYFHATYVAFLVFFIAGCFLVVRNGKVIGDFFKKVPLYLSFVLIMPMPFVWYIVLSNHTKIHHNFTFRCLSVSIFAFTSLWGRLVEYKCSSEKII